MLEPTLATSGFTALTVLAVATRGCPGSRHRYWGYLSPKLLSTGAVSGARCTWEGTTHPSPPTKDGNPGLGLGLGGRALALARTGGRGQ